MQSIGILTAFLTGLASFFAPCVLPLLPAYISYVSGVSLQEIRGGRSAYYKRHILISSGWYLLGFSSVFVLLGVAAASFGAVFRTNLEFLQLVGGVLIMIFALQFMRILPKKEWTTSNKLGNLVAKMNFSYWRSFLVGIVFATVWSPCVGPVLGAILTLAATSVGAVRGGVLLAVYSLGISVPFLLVSVLLFRVPALLTRLEKSAKIVETTTGLVLLVVGFLLANNSMQLFSMKLTYDYLSQVLFVLVGKI